MMAFTARAQAIIGFASAADSCSRPATSRSEAAAEVAARVASSVAARRASFRQVFADISASRGLAAYAQRSGASARRVTLILLLLHAEEVSGQRRGHTSGARRRRDIY